VPLLLRDSSRLTQPPFQSTPSYPMTDVVTQDVSMFDPHIRIPSADSFSLGIQRSLSTNLAMEVRYVGTRGHDSWRTNINGNNGANAANGAGTLNVNEFNIFENKFIDEFRQAQRNLKANLAATGTATFAYTGQPGTAPLPVFLAFFNGQNAVNAGNTAAYTGANWTNTTFLNFLAERNPNPFGFASEGTNGLMGNATLRNNAANAGLPANYFVANPDLLGGAFILSNIGESKYNSMQFELRRRNADGLAFQTSYVFGKGYLTNWETWRQDQFWVRDAGTPGDVTHAFKANINYELPFGQGRKWGGNANGFVDRLIGGWQVGVNTRLQSGRLIDMGNVRMVGMDHDELQSIFKLRFDDAGRKVYMLPQDVIDNTIAAFSVSATSASGYSGAAPTGRYFAPANGPDCIEVDNNADYGQCASRSLVVTGPMFSQTDIRIAKRTTIAGRTNFEVAMEMLNAFNQANFVPVGIGSSSQANQPLGNSISQYEVTTLTGTNTSRLIQFVARINW
jgi:hypothetical protein